MSRTKTMKSTNGPKIMNILKATIPLTLSVMITTCAVTPFGSFLSGGKNDRRQKKDVDLAAAAVLRAQPVPSASIPGGAQPGTPGGPPVSNLFTLPPGTMVSMSQMSGAIDPVGTSLPQDFDGDGILNANETTSNIWTGDYPIIEASIATPVTLAIQVLDTQTLTSEDISTDITSDDFDETVEQGNEKVHRDEINERTVQFQDSYASSSHVEQSHSRSTNFSSAGSAGMAVLAVAAGGSFSSSTSSSWALGTSMSQQTTQWADRPFKNNLDRSAWNIKSSAAGKKALKYRSEKRTKVSGSRVIKPDAGFVRAALYIKNESVNMPVHISNILCSLMFETPQGALVPIQSFRLRNEDFSLFELNLYGGTEFGPYVIQLTGLNTAEVEKALQNGYNPKIYLVSYDMTHVPDSNYRSSLLNYSGDNLKIVEENAKGRTALLKLHSPQVRELYRMAAFDTNAPAPVDPKDMCNPALQGTAASPGVPMRKFLKRLYCSGVLVEFENYVIDFRDELPLLREPRVFVPGVKSIGGVETKLPCTQQTMTGSDSVSRTACVMKPFSTWTEAEKGEFGMWVLFAKGKYYSNSEYVQSGGVVQTFDGQPASTGIPMAKGVDSTVWVGDEYDLVYITQADMLATVKEHGTNPLETGEMIHYNTKWDLSKVGFNAFDPDVYALFLGQAGLGDQIEITFQLKDTTYLNPSFGANVSVDPAIFEFNTFAYTPTTYTVGQTGKLFSLPEAIDFEVSLGISGEYGGWYNILRDVDPNDVSLPSACGQSINFLAQTYKVCVRLPLYNPYVAADAPVNVYLRPTLNAAYRSSIWPMPFAEVGPFRGRLALDYKTTRPNRIEVNEVVGANPNALDTIRLPGEAAPFTATSVGVCGVGAGFDNSCAPGSTISITLDRNTTVSHSQGEFVVTSAGLASSAVRLQYTTDFFSVWNALIPGGLSGDTRNDQPRPLETADVASCGTVPAYLAFAHPECLGFDTKLVEGNWIGQNNNENPYWNAWADAGRYSTWLTTIANPLIQTDANNKLWIDTYGVAPALLPYGLNNFFTAPLIERSYDVTVRIVK